MREWDPIGVAGEPNAFNEYYGYEREIADLLIANAPLEQLAKHLADQEECRMGLSPNPGRSLRAARRLQELYTELMKDCQVTAENL